MEEPEIPNPLEKLTHRQRLWVSYYIGASNGNATDAARRAGYKKPHPEGSRLLKHPDIKAAIASMYAESAMPAVEVMSRLATIARSSLADLLFPIEEDTVRGAASPAAAPGTLRIPGRLVPDPSDSDEAPRSEKDDMEEDEDENPCPDTDSTTAVDAPTVRYGFDVNKAVESGAIHAVRSIKPNRYGLIVELEDRQAALDKIARGLGIYHDNVAGQEVVVKVYTGYDMRDDV